MTSPRPSVGSSWLSAGEEHLPPGTAWLSEREAGYARSMVFTKRRTEFLLRRWAGKRAVAAATGLATDLEALAVVEIGNRPSGAPLVLLDGRPAGVDVSLSDRAGWAVCLVGQDLGDVGCDLELVEPRSDGFVADFLTPAEQRHVTALDGEARQLAANLAWSAKEAALKVLQTGLRRDTRSVEVLLADTDPASADGAWSPLQARLREGDLLSGWWRRDGVWVLTVLTRRSLPPPSDVAGSPGLAQARPVHSWLARPRTDDAG